MEHGLWYSMATAALATEETRSVVGMAIAVVLSFPAGLVGQLFKWLGRADSIPWIMGGLGWILGFAAGYYGEKAGLQIPQDWASMVLGAAGFGSGVAHDAHGIVADRYRTFHARQLKRKEQDNA